MAGHLPHRAARRLLARFRDDPAWTPLRTRWTPLLEAGTAPPPRDLLQILYRDTADALEPALWQGEPDETLLADYQALFRDLEQVASQGSDPRHRFVVVVPVADRPQQLADCLDSLLTLCERFEYGARRDGRFRKVAVLVVDDSLEAANRERIRAVAADTHRRGLDTRYLGPEEQRACVARHAARRPLPHILGATDSAFVHKGASVTRNVAYLALHETTGPDERVLFYFVDSDQEFRVRIDGADGERNLYAINYFHQLDRIFSTTGAHILTGKVVGAPPVSPAVMAGNLLEDLIAFLTALSAVPGDAPCRFHGGDTPHLDEAAYHDMAELFGFRPSGDSRRYHCPLHGPHDHADCLTGLVARLDPFFDGEHPTRHIHYRHRPPLASLAPARTVYTGNYVLRRDALDYFIPFAPLKLRMAGPALGRIIRAQLHERFVSANLPMLHRRTLHRTRRSEFRPGIRRQAEAVDLAEELERQYFGDVMLFSVERLAEQGYPDRPAGEERIAEVVETVEADLRRRYTERHVRTLQQFATLRTIYGDPGRWWQQSPSLADTRRDFERFLDNFACNFGEDAPGYRHIACGDHAVRRRREIVQAIAGYPADRNAWRQMLAEEIRTAPETYRPDR